MDGSTSNAEKSRESRERVLAEIAGRARADPAGTLNNARRLDPLVHGESDRLAYLYESLAREARHWEDLFANELERMLALSEEHPKSSSALSLLDTFMFLDGKASDALRSRIQTQLVKALGSTMPATRCAAASIAGSFLDGDPTRLRSSLESALGDADWRVRKFAEGSLADNGLLPDRYSPRMVDRVRGWLSGPPLDYV